MARTATARDRRLRAVQDLVDEILVMERSVPHISPGLSRYDVATKIRALAVLARTADWRNAVERWAADVEDPAISVAHAVLRGQVYPVRAA